MSNDGEVVARPWPKFFCLGDTRRPETQVENLPSWQPEVTTKLDGFFLTASNYEGQLVVASRGSFDSPHALWAAKRCPFQAQELMIGLTHIFEGLCADLRIVVKYQQDEIVLTGLIVNETGQEMTHDVRYRWAEMVGMRTVGVHGKTLPELEREMKTSKEGEGYVMTWYFVNRPSLKIKLKTDDYSRLVQAHYGGQSQARVGSSALRRWY